MKRQLFISQLTMLFEQGTAQHRLRRKALPSRVLEVLFAKIGSHQPGRSRCHPATAHRLQFATDLVRGENIE